MSRRTLSKLENGERAVTLDEAIELAAALDVAPIHLLIPPENEATVTVVPGSEIPARAARAWARGHRPLPFWDVDDRTYVTEVPDGEFRLAENTSYRWFREFLENLENAEEPWTEADFLNAVGEFVTGMRVPRFMTPEGIEAKAKGTIGPEDKLNRGHERRSEFLRKDVPDSRDQEGK